MLVGARGRTERGWRASWGAVLALLFFFLFDLVPCDVRFFRDRVLRILSLFSNIFLWMVRAASGLLIDRFRYVVQVGLMGTNHICGARRCVARFHFHLLLVRILRLDFGLTSLLFCFDPGLQALLPVGSRITNLILGTMYLS